MGHSYSADFTIPKSSETPFEGRLIFCESKVGCHSQAFEHRVKLHDKHIVLFD